MGFGVLLITQHLIQEILVNTVLGIHAKGANSGSKAERPRCTNRRRFNMSKEEKRRLQFSYIYAHNAFMMLDKECEAERHAKAYKETNKEREEWRTSIQRQRDNKRKRIAVVIIQKYTHKWMGRHAYLKLLSATTFIQCCYRQLRARKELQRLKQEAKELSIKPVGDSKTNHLDERGNDTIQVRSDSDFDVKFSIIQFYAIEHNSKSNRWIELNFDM
jgi:hypothetical protein